MDPSSSNSMEGLIFRRDSVRVEEGGIGETDHDSSGGIMGAYYQYFDRLWGEETGRMATDFWNLDSSK